MNRLILFLGFQVLLMSVVSASAPDENYASQRSDYKAKKHERTIAQHLLNNDIFEKCYDSFGKDASSEMIRRYVKVLAMRIPAHGEVPHETIGQLSEKTPLDKRELLLIVSGSLKDQEAVISQKDVDQALIKLYEVLYGQRLTDEQKDVLSRQFQSRLMRNYTAIKVKLNEAAPEQIDQVDSSQS